MSKVVVGGGVAGLLAAILLKRKQPKHNVILIEQDESCGGLLKSISSELGDEFDYGTHIPGQTAIKELDDILFAGMNAKYWHFLDKLKPGNYFSGELYKYSQLIHVASLPIKQIAELTYDFLNIDRASTGHTSNLEQYLKTTYGNVVTETVFRPLMTKLLNTPLINLHPNAHKLFGYERLILGSDSMMRELKKSSELDKLLAFKTYNEGISSNISFYPKNGKGVGLWVEQLVNQAKEIGVSVRTNTRISNIELQNQSINHIQLDDNESIECSDLVWTIPLFMLIKLSGIDFTPQYKPNIRGLSLHHFVFDQPFLTDNYFVCCNDPEMKSFRITLYSNIHPEGQQNGRSRCTVEVLTEDHDNLAQLDNIIINELKKMGVVHNQANPLYHTNQIVRAGFPVLTTGFVSELERQNSAITDSIKNITLLGKASANNFFMNSVLTEVYDKLK